MLSHTARAARGPALTSMLLLLASCNGSADSDVGAAAAGEGLAGAGETEAGGQTTAGTGGASPAAGNEVGSSGVAGSNGSGGVKDSERAGNTEPTVGGKSGAGGAQAGGAKGSEGGSEQTGNPGVGGAAASGGSTAAQGGMTGGSVGAGGGGVGMSKGGAPTASPDVECLQMVDAASAFIGALSEPLRAQLTFPWDDGERSALEFLPPGNAARKGLSAKELDAAQISALDTFLRSALSAAGYDKVAAIRQLEIALRGDPDYRDPENYFISIFGEPNSEQAPWGWRFEGHHLSVHSSVVACKQYSATPAFWGASGHKSPEESPLRSEADLAKTLFDSLGAMQAAAEAGSKGTKAIDAKKKKPETYADVGANAADFTDAQKATLLQLIGTYTGNMPKPVADQRMLAIEKAGVDQIKFVYKSDGYYRLQGPTFIIEHAPAGTNHVHAIWRDFDGDWGQDLLQRHMAEMHPEN